METPTPTPSKVVSLRLTEAMVPMITIATTPKSNFIRYPVNVMIGVLILVIAPWAQPDGMVVFLPVVALAIS